MQIQLKQQEIETALKLYIHHQGINLAGKDVKALFVSGRKENKGVSVELTIEDIPIPEFVLPVTIQVAEPLIDTDEPEKVTTEPVEVIPEPEVIIEDVPIAPVVNKAISLFK